MMWLLLAAVVLAAGLGYAVGRFRTGQRLSYWAEDQYGRGPWRVQWLLAQPVLSFQIVYCLVVHPVRSYRHLRSYGKPEALEPVPAPLRDPDWVSRRAGNG